MWGKQGCGAVLTQHTTDPRLGPRGLQFLAAGLTAEQAMDRLVATAECAPARQLAVVDGNGGSAAWAGEYVDPAASYTHAFDGFAVVGNLLAHPSVGEAIADWYRNHETDDFAERLVGSLAAGSAAGGEQGSLRSAALKVYGEHDFAYVDLRVDRDPDPIRALAELNVEFTLRRDDYVRRALDPDVSYAASYAPSARRSHDSCHGEGCGTA